MSSRNQRTAKRRGFTNRFKTVFQIINVERLARFESGTEVNPAILAASGLVRDEHAPIKILGNGELAVAVHVDGVELSQGARQKIEAAGGSVTVPVTEASEEASGVTGGA